jgi:hypothetical protein
MLLSVLKPKSATSELVFELSERVHLKSRCGGGVWKVASHDSLTVALLVKSNIVIFILGDHLRESLRIWKEREKIDMWITR